MNDVTYDSCNRQGSVDCETFPQFQKSLRTREVVDRIGCPLERETVTEFHPHLESQKFRFVQTFVECIQSYNFTFRSMNDNLLGGWNIGRQKN